MTNINSPYQDEGSNTTFNYDQWRGRFLGVMLWVICGLGIILILPIILISSSSDLVIFGVVYFVFLAITIIPLPYNSKAGALITVGYFISLYTLIQFGPWSDSTIFFLTTTLFTALLFDEKIDWWVFAINTASLLIMGILDITGQFEVAEKGLSQINAYDWLIYIAKYVVLAIASLWGINLLKSEFQNIAEQFHMALFFVNEDNTDLEEQVNERTAGLLKKTDQLRAAADLGRQTADVQDLEAILNLVVNLVVDQFDFYHTGIFIMNDLGDEAILRAASSEGGKRMIASGHSFKVGTKSIVGFSAFQKKPRIVLDVESDPLFTKQTDLPNTQSELALPLLIRDRVLGVLDVQSDQPQAFGVDDIDVLQTLTDQLAVAIENTRLLEGAKNALIQVEALTTERTRETWSKKVQEGNYTYTYTPLGMRAGKGSENSKQSINIPITLRGQKIGSISLARKDNMQWSDMDFAMINEVAYQTGLAVDNVRLVEEATERAKQEQTVGELAARFSQSTDIDSLLQTAVREIGQVADVAEVSVYLGKMPEQSPQKRRTKQALG